MPTKDEAVQELIDWHFQIAPEIVKVYRFLSDNENAPDEPIKLLEVNKETLATGRVTPFGFAKTEEIPYTTVIAMVTPEEMNQIEENSLPLPRGWNLENTRPYTRPDADHSNGRKRYDE